MLTPTLTRTFSYYRNLQTWLWRHPLPPPSLRITELMLQRIKQTKAHIQQACNTNMPLKFDLKISWGTTRLKISKGMSSLTDSFSFDLPAMEQTVTIGYNLSKTCHEVLFPDTTPLQQHLQAIRAETDAKKTAMQCNVPRLHQKCKTKWMWKRRWTFTLCECSIRFWWQMWKTARTTTTKNNIHKHT